MISRYINFLFYSILIAHPPITEYTLRYISHSAPRYPCKSFETHWPSHFSHTVNMKKTYSQSPMQDTSPGLELIKYLPLQLWLCIKALTFASKKQAMLFCLSG